MLHSCLLAVAAAGNATLLFSTAKPNIDITTENFLMSGGMYRQDFFEPKVHPVRSDGFVSVITTDLAQATTELGQLFFVQKKAADAAAVLKARQAMSRPVAVSRKKNSIETPAPPVSSPDARVAESVLREKMDDASATWGAIASAATISIAPSNFKQRTTALGQQFFANKTASISHIRERMRTEAQASALADIVSMPPIPPKTTRAPASSNRSLPAERNMPAPTISPDQRDWKELEKNVLREAMEIDDP